MASHRAATVTGLEDFRAHITNRAAIVAALVTRLDALGVLLVAEIKARCPAVTGALRDSIRHEVKVRQAGAELLIHVGSAQAYYAGFVEYGDSRDAAHPFVRPVINAHQAGIALEIAAVIERYHQQ